jgi:outer membrane receptor for ferrienterochelin and colicins
MSRTSTAWAALILVSSAEVALAQATAPKSAPLDAAGSTLAEIQVVAQRLNEARSSIQTQTGASTYTIDAAALAATPGGDNSLLNQVILQAPEVTQDSFGQFHVRGEHNGLQYRINGMILPEGMAAFGQSLDPRLIASMSLITGALPAEYGLRTAGIIDISTKSGILDPGGSVSFYGGSHGTIQPSVNYGGGVGDGSYFISADVLHNNRGIESPDGSATPRHDHTAQAHVFGYLDNILNEHNRIALMIGSSVGTFQIPNRYGLQPSLGLTVSGVTLYPSQNLDQHQREVTQFAVMSWQHAADRLNVQSSVIARYSSLTFVPDLLGDLLYNGLAQAAFKQNVAYAFQSDGALELNDTHTLRAGAFLQSDQSRSLMTSAVLATTDQGIPLNDTPLSLTSNSAQTESIVSAYAQDEWKLSADLTLNYGLRFDQFTAYTRAHQLSPRLNVVWKALPQTTLHAGYARYFSPPPFELVGSKDIALFNNTTNAPLSHGADLPQPERAHYYDVGVQQKVTHYLTIALDTYLKQSSNLIDEGQFGAPIILTPFNYRYGKQKGVELTLNYAAQDLTAYLNLAVQSAKGKAIDSSQFNFAPADLLYIAAHDIHLDHEQQHTASGGVSYLWNQTRVSADFLYGSGLRADQSLPSGEVTPFGGTGIPNGMSLPMYTQVNLGVSQVLHPAGLGPLSLRLDILNVFDATYEIRDGTGVGVGAPQFGPRRGVFAGASFRF